MAVAPTGAIYKAMTIDGESSRTYGVYITGKAVYNAPQREVEMISIAGRNGKFALDKGRFENIEVTYPAGIYAETEEDFAEAVSNFRNYLCSRDGYVRIEDEYNPNEYRMGVYKSGLEVTPKLLKAGEFDITFDCKPQRWLTSGETAVTIGEWGETETASGDIVSVENPTGILAVKALAVSLSPIQDLNGYDKPWVGGAGKNKVSNVTYSNPTTRYGAAILASYSLEEGKRYIFSFMTSNTGEKVYRQTPQLLGIKSASAYSFVCDGTRKSFYGTASATASISNKGIILKDQDDGVAVGLCSQFMVEPVSDSTTTPSDYEPYENICPISGRTSVDTIVSPTTSATDGRTYTTALGRTVYGGTLDVVSGVLTVDRAMVDLGSLSWSYQSTWTSWCTDYRADVKGTTVGTAKPNLVAEQYGVLTTNDAITPNTGYGISTTVRGSSGSRIIARNGSSTTKPQGKLVYELATPQTYQLTPQQISLLTGDNNIWSDGAVTLEYGQNPSVLFNPTLFESSPMLQVEGYGEVGINGETISIQNEEIGQIQISKGGSTRELSLSTELLNTGDTFSPDGNPSIKCSFKYSGALMTISATGTESILAAADKKSDVRTLVTFWLTAPVEFIKGTSATIKHSLTTVFYLKQTSADSRTPHNVTFNFTIYYDGDHSVTLTLTHSNLPTGVTKQSTSYTHTAYSGISTKIAFPQPLYIDLDIGEAYGEESGQIVSLNDSVELPSDLPKLSSGANTITYSGDITDLKIIPRWWKV